MSIIKGEKITASKWNSFIRDRSKEVIFSKTLTDVILQNDDDSGDGYFWNRNSGFDWGTVYNSTEHKGPFEIGSKYTVIENNYLVQLIAVKNPSTTVPPTSGSADWDIVMYEWGYQGTNNVQVDDYVVYGGGKFKCTTDTTSPPVLPKYGSLSYSDPNYNLVSVDNTKVTLRRHNSSFFLTLHLYLKRPGLSDLEIYSRVNTSIDHEDSFWLPPGYYYYTWKADEGGGIGLKKALIQIEGKQYDDSVLEFKQIRSFSSDLSYLENPFSFGELTAANAVNDPRLTDDQIDKKGGTASSYTGVW